MKIKIVSFLALLVLLGFLFIMVIPSEQGWNIHEIGKPLRNPDVFKDPEGSKYDHVKTMDDYFLRNGQRETGSNNIVTSVVFDYRGFDTLGESTVLFLTMSSIYMLFYQLLRKKKYCVVFTPGLHKGKSRIVFYSAVFLFPLILTYGFYLILHGHLSPGGGFQGGAVAASGVALSLIGSSFSLDPTKTRKALALVEAIVLVLIVTLGLSGLSSSFLFNFLATPDSFLNSVELGFTGSDLTSGGILPLYSLGEGIQVFCGMSIILIMFFIIGRET